MKLVKDARQATRWFSVQAMALATAIQGAWLSVPADMKSSFPEWVIPAVACAILVLGIVGRLVDQTPKDEDDEHAQFVEGAGHD